MNKQKTPITILRMLLGRTSSFLESGLYANFYSMDISQNFPLPPDLTTQNESTMKGFVSLNMRYLTNNYMLQRIIANPLR